MDYEKKIREYMASSEVDQLYKSMLINLFPELAESEDEKIKKELISHLHDTLDVCTGKNADLVKKWIAWLEKQGEQKPVEWSEEDEDNILHICCWLNEYGNFLLGKSEDKSNRIFKTVDWLKSIKDRCLPQQQEWSEEDKYLLSSCISIFERIGDGDLIKGNKDDANKFISFLKSLRPQKQQYDDEWSDEDKDFLKWTLNNLAELKDRYGEDYGKVGKCIDWLNSLQPQPIDVEAAIAYQEGYQKAELEFYQKQQEWTDEDINMIDWLIRCCEKEHEELCNDKYGHQDIVSDLKRDCRKKWNWLESLKEKVAPQKQWKPSKEQIKAFEYCIDNNCCDKDGVNGSKMVELYQQLKAL